MSIDLYIEAFEKMPGEDEKMFYRLWSYNRVNIFEYETDVNKYSEILMPIFNEIFERKKKEDFYSDCRYQYEYVVCLSPEEVIKISDIIFEELKKENPQIDDLQFLLAISPGAGEFVDYIELCKTDEKEKEDFFNNYWITLYLC